MLRNSRYAVACAAIAFTLASFLIGLEISSTTAAPSTSQPSVNRALKADRLPLASERSRNAVNGPVENKTPAAPAAIPQMLDGCEPVVSSIGHSPLSRIPGRCLS
jgi:hypothetical protein